MISTWLLFEMFAELRKHLRFEAVQAQVQAHFAAERLKLERLRAEGLVPDRGEGTQTAQQGGSGGD